MTRPFIKERADEIVDLAVKHGLNAALIAERFGCGRQTVSKVLKGEGYEWNPTADRWVPQNSATSSSLGTK